MIEEGKKKAEAKASTCGCDKKADQANDIGTSIEGEMPRRPTKRSLVRRPLNTTREALT